MLVPDIYVGRLSLINCWNYAMTKSTGDYCEIRPFSVWCTFDRHVQSELPN